MFESLCEFFLLWTKATSRPQEMKISRTHSNMNPQVCWYWYVSALAPYRLPSLFFLLSISTLIKWNENNSSTTAFHPGSLCSNFFPQTQILLRCNVAISSRNRKLKLFPPRRTWAARKMQKIVVNKTNSFFHQKDLFSYLLALFTRQRKSWYKIADFIRGGQFVGYVTVEILHLSSLLLYAAHQKYSSQPLGNLWMTWFFPPTYDVT